MKAVQKSSMQDGVQKHWRRAAFAGLSCLALGLGQAQAQQGRPVTVVLPFAVGSQVDLLARALFEHFSKTLNQPFVMMNREGAAGILGVDSVKMSKPDGHTLGFGSQGPFTIQPSLRSDLRFRAEDFEYICQTNTGVLVVASGPTSRYGTMPELLDAARKAPGTVSFGSTGVGSGPHLIGEGISLEAKVKFNHIPYKSIADLNTQVIGGGIDFVITTPLLVTGRKDMRVLAVVGAQKLTSHPQAPLLKDLGFKRGAIPGFFGVYAPKGTPESVLAAYRQICPGAVNSAAFKTAAEINSAPLAYANSSEYTRSILEDRRAMAELIAGLGIKPE